MNVVCDDNEKQDDEDVWTVFCASRGGGVGGLKEPRSAYNMNHGPWQCYFVEFTGIVDINKSGDLFNHFCTN